MDVEVEVNASCIEVFEEGDEMLERPAKAADAPCRHHLFFAFVFNAAGVPIAAGVLYPWFGILLSPIIAGAAMAVSSVTVIGNSLRLRGARL